MSQYDDVIVTVNLEKSRERRALVFDVIADDGSYMCQQVWDDEFFKDLTYADDFMEVALWDLFTTAQHVQYYKGVKNDQPQERRQKLDSENGFEKRRTD